MWLGLGLNSTATACVSRRESISFSSRNDLILVEIHFHSRRDSFSFSSRIDLILVEIRKQSGLGWTAIWLGLKALVASHASPRGVCPNIIHCQRASQSDVATSFVTLQHASTYYTKRRQKGAFWCLFGGHAVARLV
jgi:hypothetical protein